jgi:hypothetical protein
VAVGALSPASIDTALAGGLACARGLVSRGLIGHALIGLAGHWLQTADRLADVAQCQAPGAFSFSRAA